MRRSSSSAADFLQERRKKKKRRDLGGEDGAGDKWRIKGMPAGKLRIQAHHTEQR